MTGDTWHMEFKSFKKNLLFVYIFGIILVSVLLSVHVKKFSVSRRQNLFVIDHVPSNASFSLALQIKNKKIRFGSQNIKIRLSLAQLTR